MLAIRLIVGLANPGEEYHLTRHNAGAWYINRLAKDAGTALKPESKLKCATGKYPGNRLLAIPLTYMNDSGQALQAIMHYYKIAPQNILVAHDELDLAPGDIRLKKDGGHGGHNGLRSIFKHLGTQDFWRLRIGIGHPGHKNKVTGYVLKAPSKQDKEHIDDALCQAEQITSAILDGNFEHAMQQLHTR